MSTEIGDFELLYKILIIPLVERRILASFIALNKIMFKFLLPNNQRFMNLSS